MLYVVYVIPLIHSRVNEFRRCTAASDLFGNPIPVSSDSLSLSLSLYVSRSCVAFRVGGILILTQLLGTGCRQLKQRSQPGCLTL